MSTLRDPPRLRDSATDPILRSALREIGRDAPSLQALEQFAHRTQRALQSEAAHASVPASKLSGALKLGVLACVVTSAVYLGRPSSERPAAPSTTQPPAVATAPSTAQAKLGAREAPLDAEPTRTVPQALAPASTAHTAEPRSSRRELRRRLSTPPSGASNSSPVAQPVTQEALPPSAASEQPQRSHPQNVTPPGEVELLEAAQHAFLHDPARALELLRRHAQLYPSGTFAQEREALSLDALAHLQRWPDLRERAQVFLKSYPRSPHAARIRDLLEKTK